MLLKNGKKKRKVPYSQQQFVDANRMLVESYKKFESEELGFTKPTNLLEDLEEYDDPIREATCAILMENFVRKTMGTLDETSRADLPTWVKHGLALITSSQADDLTGLVISEQPLPAKAGKIHYMDIQTERSKGDLPSGTRMFDALRGFIGTDSMSSEDIDAEPFGVAGTAGYNVNLEYLPVIPRSVEITDGTQIVVDDGNGNLVGDIQAAGGGFNNTINYITGAASVNFAVNTTASVTSYYTYNIEAADVLPTYGISLRGITVEARPRAIATKWSQQAVFDLINEWGIDAEPTILDAGAKIIAAEKFKHVVNHLNRRATGGQIVFDNTTPTGISYQEHIDSFGILTSRLQNTLWENTQRVRPNVCVCAPNILFLYQYSKGFQGEGTPGQTDSLAGPKKAGILTAHGITVICDPTFPANKAVYTYNGNELVNTASILANYIPLYKAPIHSHGLHKDTALLTEYAIHDVNTDMMGTLEVTNL